MRLGVRRALAEDLLLRPIQDQILSADAMDRACRLIRQLSEEEFQQPVVKLGADNAKILEKIARYESMIAAEADCAEELRPIIERLHEEMARARHSASAKGNNRPATEIPAERAYRAHVEGIARLLKGTQIGAARTVLKDVLGEIPVHPDPTGSFLIAQLSIRATPLFRAAGIGQIGSGGRI